MPIYAILVLENKTGKTIKVVFVNIKTNLILIIILATIFLSFAFIGCSGDDDDDDNSSADDDGQSDDDLTDDDDDTSDDDDDDDDDSGPSTEDCEPYGYSASPTIIRGPYLQHVTKNTIRILWQTDTPSNSIVRFGQTDDLGFFQCDLTEETYHQVEVEKLSMETQYHYQVRSSGAESEPATFATAPDIDTPFTFAVYGDNRTLPANHQAVVDVMTDEVPDLILNVGDVVTSGWSKSQFDTEFFDQIGPLLRTTPVYISIGNHEGESPFYFQYFSFPGNQRWYKFDYGNARFLALDTNWLYLPGTEQYKWFAKELDQAQSDQVQWIFVFSHHPAYSEGWVGYVGELQIRNHLLPLMEQYGVDIFFNGHTHTYERGTLNGVTQILTGGGGGPLDPCVRDFEHIDICSANFHFVKVEISGADATITALDTEGTTIDTLTLP